MKRILLIFILLLMASPACAQRDTDHWFAPMVASSTNGSPKQALYLSTDSTTPFPVSIYNNNTVIGTVTISKGNPQTFDVPWNLMTGQNTADAMSVKTRGLYLHGDLPFFATYRFSEINHGEILTSKGKAGIGNKFYAVYAPLMNNQSSQNFSCGILATEDNTQVKVSGYAMTTWFYNNFNGLTHPSITITLNKGQSYVFAGYANKPGNKDGFIGAKIESTKPVSVTNGNYHGQFGLAPPYNGEDIVMDQSVPVERLGQEFVMIKGMGNLLPEIEGAVIVATENNTEIRLNDNPTPVATLNEGQYYRVSAMNYIANGPSHLNMYIKASKNVYVYQLLSGIEDNDATEGFNYIPPLNCFLPTVIDEIGKIGELPYYTSFNPPLVVKLNILTQAGAAVTVNGIPTTAAQGPFPVTGTKDWVSYSVPNISGNVTVASTKAVTAGIIGGSGNLGYGGYFAGFNSIPVIKKSAGECIPGIVLEVESGFDHYQWNLNGNPIPGANSNTYTPTQGGSYTVSITKSTCTPLTTYPYKVYTCLTNTVKTLNICSAGKPVTITPAFTNSTQIPVPGTVQVITSPANGTLTVNSTTGILTYTANAGTTTDTFTYKFCGNDPDFTDCEQVKVNITVQPLILTDTTVKTCPTTTGTGIFDLTAANVGGPANVTKQYYPTLADLNAGTNEIIPANAYSSVVPASIYVKVTTAEGCTANAKITLQFYPAPNIQNATLNGCFVPTNPSTGTFDLTSALVTTTAPVTKKYYPTLIDATNGTNEILTPANYISPNATVYVKVITANGCYDFAQITLNIIPPKPSPLLTDQYICPDAKITLNAGPGYTSYLWSTGATTPSITVSIGSYWVILTSGGCETKQLVKVMSVPVPKVKKVEVTHNTATITAEGGTPPYQYSRDGMIWQDSNVFTNLPRGKNNFYVKDSYNCSPVETQILVPNLINAITPNSDGINDTLDYSQLAFLKDLKFGIFNRYGQLIYSSEKSNTFKWDGTIGGNPVSSGTYWYEIKWADPETQNLVTYTGWILVKNRN
ncbi:gliding motility-associated C-terminal domain-containing protein [Chryseobacterium arthrosphaerae]|uniref:T9SS type B sorting domain-containing protein n=1 Tax=Chryseobacterium arthrosphaerae TaxID=651561 RepID=UPI000F4DAACB|nr:T9SS type B sorting domain-containing protein [Chryseobacterium arthrosphaerae]AYZ10987.1 gliding motility-associated C-terminal domain-containing protein [Chryseobacterium arthrosphaerae]